MATDNSERLLNEIGQLLVADGEYAREPTLLYAQLDHNMIGESIFNELGNQLLYRLPVNERLPYALLELWRRRRAMIGGRKSSMCSAAVRGRLHYPDEIDPEEDILERRERSLLRHFGGKPIVYPPLPPEDDTSHHDV